MRRMYQRMVAWPVTFRTHFVTKFWGSAFSTNSAVGVPAVGAPEPITTMMPSLLADAFSTNPAGAPVVEAGSEPPSPAAPPITSPWLTGTPPVTVKDGWIWPPLRPLGARDDLVIPPSVLSSLFPFQVLGVQWLHRALSFPDAPNTGAVLAGIRWHEHLQHHDQQMRMPVQQSKWGEQLSCFVDR